LPALSVAPLQVAVKFPLPPDIVNVAFVAIPIDSPARPRYALLK
jgi:hypothetical protein